MKLTETDNSDGFERITMTAQGMEFSFPAHLVNIQENGIEFLSEKEIPTWIQMTVELQPPNHAEPLHCQGIVVSCSGNRHAGYVVSIVFTNNGPEEQDEMSELVYSEPSLRF